MRKRRGDGGRHQTYAHVERNEDFNLCHMWTHTDMCGMQKYLHREGLRLGYRGTEGKV